MLKPQPKSKLNQADALAECLSRAGLFPRGVAAGHDRLPVDRGADLLPAAVAMWESSGDASKSRGRRGATFRWLEDQRERGAALTVGLPRPGGQAAERWLAARLVWWPDGICTATRVGVASSRLGRRLDEQQAWFAVLRGACDKLDGDREVLLTAAGTASARFVEHAAKRFAVPVLRIEVPKSDGVGLQQWLRRICVPHAGEHHEGLQRAILSPPIPDPASLDVAATETSDLPLRDRALVAVSDRILAFRVRRGGNLQQLLIERLHDPAWPLASVYVALGEDLTASKTAGELLDAGAVGWVVSTRQLRRCESAERPASIPGWLVDGPRLHRRPAAIVEPPPSDRWEYLTHCTRRRAGPWPEQSEAEFLDDLILQRQDMPHSALASLARIVHDRCLRASKEGIRGGTPVVSFTAAPLDEIARLRVFRSHRGRWDFEPYGICISQDWLAERGARSVHYGSDQLWQSLPAAERPFFQVGRSVTADQVMLWTAEREWRHAGDLDLRRLPRDAAFVFVPTPAEADEIATISPWPVAVV